MKFENQSSVAYTQRESDISYYERVADHRRIGPRRRKSIKDLFLQKISDFAIMNDCIIMKG